MGFVLVFVFGLCTFERFLVRRWSMSHVYKADIEHIITNETLRNDSFKSFWRLIIAVYCLQFVL